MELHDKDLDRLFRVGLQDLEAAPAAGTWDNIAAGLNQRSGKKSLMPYLRIAASVMILLGAGIWLLLKQPENNVKQGKHTQTVAQTTNHKVDKQQQPDTHTHTFASQEQTVEMAVVKSSGMKSHSPEITKYRHHNGQLNQQAEQPRLAAVNTSAHMVLSQPVVPDEIIAAQPVEDRPVFHSITALPAVQTLAAVPSNKLKPKKHGIHSLGDVVNLVVAKVDKRENKLIEFTDTDDDEAVVTGINLGLFRIKKEQ